MRHFYWLYHIPTFFSLVIVVAIFCLFTALAHFLLNQRVRKWWRPIHENNDFIYFYFVGISLFYGTMLGFLAAGAWQNVNVAEDATEREAATVVSMYRLSTHLPPPYNTRVHEYINRYVHTVITKDWPDQEAGELPVQSGYLLDTIQHQLSQIMPRNEKDVIICDVVLENFNKLSAHRRVRANTAILHIPDFVWFVVLLASVLIMVLVGTFSPENRIQATILNNLFAITIGIIIFSVFLLDNPYMGATEVKSEPFQNIEKQFFK